MTSVGGVAGGKARGRRYFTVQLHGVKYACHRIVWILFGGKLDKKDILDHFDRDQANNRISNLRLVTHKSNAENRRISSLNTTGTTGVQLCNYEDRWYYCASWKVDRKTKTKKFNVSKFGLIPAMAMAIKFRREKIAELNAQGASYTENHGKE